MCARVEDLRKFNRPLVAGPVLPPREALLRDVLAQGPPAADDEDLVAFTRLTPKEARCGDLAGVDAV